VAILFYLAMAILFGNAVWHTHATHLPQLTSENGNIQSNYSVISHSFVELIRHVILHYMQ
jgi:hypothetical protein